MFVFEVCGLVSLRSFDIRRLIFLVAMLVVVSCLLCVVCSFAVCCELCFVVLVCVVCCCLVSCRLFDECLLFVWLLRDCCLFVFVCGLLLLAIVALCFLRAVVAYASCSPFVVVCCPLFGAYCVFVAACVL